MNNFHEFVVNIIKSVPVEQLGIKYQNYKCVNTVLHHVFDIPRQDYLKKLFKVIDIGD